MYAHYLSFLRFPPIFCLDDLMRGWCVMSRWFASVREALVFGWLCLVMLVLRVLDVFAGGRVFEDFG